MNEEKVKRKAKSFSLKYENAEKIEQIAFEEKRKQSDVVDEMVEVYDGTR